MLLCLPFLRICQNTLLGLSTLDLENKGAKWKQHVLVCIYSTKWNLETQLGATI